MEFDPIFSIIAFVLLLCYLGMLFWQWQNKKSSAALGYSSLEMLKSGGKTWKTKYYPILKILRIVAVILLLIAFARPRKGLEVIKTARKGITIQMVIDRSSSMNEPLSYNGLQLDRLQVVKKVFEEFILGNDDLLKGRSNDMIGLTSFSGFVEENSPLTLDHQSLVNFAKTIRTASRIEDGTMIGDALYYATLRLIAVDELLKKAGEQDQAYQVKSKIIILLTDGQQTQGGMNPLEAAGFAKDNNIKVYTIAIVDSENYQRKDSVFGQFFSLMNRQLDTTLLEKVASKTGGVFAKASSGESLVKIYQQIDELEKSQFEERFTTYKEQFIPFVYAGFALLLLELLLTQTLFRKIP